MYISNLYLPKGNTLFPKLLLPSGVARPKIFVQTFNLHSVFQIFYNHLNWVSKPVKSLDKYFMNNNTTSVSKGKDRVYQS